MADVPSIAKLVTVEETNDYSPSSESMMQKIGGSINYILDKLDLQPIGTIDGAFLTEVQYQSFRTNKWVLCDGRNVVGSRYSEITSETNIPDARGLFLRMKNYDQFTNQGNPDGDLALGDYQFDELASHNHSFVITEPLNRQLVVIDLLEGHIAEDGSERINVQDDAASWPLTLNPTGSVETAPRNTTLNWFIKIN